MSERDVATGLWRDGHVYSVKRKRAHPEDTLHAACRVFADRMISPSDGWFVSWENRGGGYAAGANRKARGVVAGWPDAGLARRSGVIDPYFEFKAHRGVLSLDQKSVHARLRALGCFVYVVRSLDEFEVALIERGVDLRGRVL